MKASKQQHFFSVPLCSSLIVSVFSVALSPILFFICPSLSVSHALVCPIICPSLSFLKLSVLLCPLRALYSSPFCLSSCVRLSCSRLFDNYVFLYLCLQFPVPLCLSLTCCMSSAPPPSPRLSLPLIPFPLCPSLSVSHGHESGSFHLYYCLSFDLWSGHWFLPQTKHR